MGFNSVTRGNLAFQTFLIAMLCTVECCNIGPGNLGFGNIGMGNIGLFNWGLGNAGFNNRGVLTAGITNTGVATTGIRNIGVGNLLPVPNTISIANIPVVPNLGPLRGRRKRRYLISALPKMDK